MAKSNSTGKSLTLALNASLKAGKPALNIGITRALRRKESEGEERKQRVSFSCGFQEEDHFIGQTIPIRKEGSTR